MRAKKAVLVFAWHSKILSLQSLPNLRRAFYCKQDSRLAWQSKNPLPCGEFGAFLDKALNSITPTTCHTECVLIIREVALFGSKRFESKHKISP